MEQNLVIGLLAVLLIAVLYYYYSMMQSTGSSDQAAAASQNTSSTASAVPHTTTPDPVPPPLVEPAIPHATTPDVPLAPLVGSPSYSTVSGGPCRDAGGQYPKWKGIEGVSADACKQQCDSDSTCVGYSVAAGNRCQLYGNNFPNPSSTTSVVGKLTTSDSRYPQWTCYAKQ